MESVYGAAEGFFNSMGMMTGSLAPVKRAAFGAAVGYGVMETLRPSFAYYEDGTKRPWSFSTEGAEADAHTLRTNGAGRHSTDVPWFVGPAVGAFICGVLI